MEGVGLQLGSVEIGVLLATLLYGIVTLQAFLYAKKDNTDTLWIRIIVGSVWIIETFHTFCIWWTLYWWTITNYGQREELNTVLWSFATTFAMSATEASIVQSFFAYRVYMFSGRWFVPVVAWAGTIVRFVLGILRVALLVKMKTISRFLASYAWLLTTSMALNATVDIWISCGLCYCLFRVRPMLQDTRKIVDQLLMYTIEIGLLTSLCAIGILFSVNLRQHENRIFLALYFIYPKLISNSLFTSLNTRRRLRRTAPTDTVISTRHDRSNHARALPLDTEGHIVWDVFPKESHSLKSLSEPHDSSTVKESADSSESLSPRFNTIPPAGVSS